MVLLQEQGKFIIQLISQHKTGGQPEQINLDEAELKKDYFSAF